MGPLQEYIPENLDDAICEIRRLREELANVKWRLNGPLGEAIRGHAAWCYRIEYTESARCCCGVANDKDDDDDEPDEP